MTSSPAPDGTVGGWVAGSRPLRILVVCTGNICRSPMAEAMVRAEAGVAGLDVHVASVGMRAMTGPADPQARRVMAARGLDIGPHRARRFQPPDACVADLVLAMERAQVVEIVAAAGAVLGHTFTLPEFVRLGSTVGPLGDGSFAEWLHSIAAQRNPAAMLRSNPADEVADPFGRSRRAFNRCADQLEQLCAATVALLAT